jgi:hypothetical protein
MNKCFECGKKIKKYRSYRHPTYGRSNYVCGECFDKIDESLTKWREFVISNSFNNNGDNYGFIDFVNKLIHKNKTVKIIN